MVGDLLCFGGKHRGLVDHPNLAEIACDIESRRALVAELLIKLLPPRDRMH